MIGRYAVRAGLLALLMAISTTNVAAAVSELGCDFNGDGSVDSLDLESWRISYTRDLHGVDFLCWQEQYGTAFLAADTSAPELHSVPEPSTAALMFLTTVVVTATPVRGLRRLNS